MDVGAHKDDVGAAAALGATQAQRVHHHDERHILDCISSIVDRSHEVAAASGDNISRSFDNEHLVVGEGELANAVNRELGTGGSFVAHRVVVGDVGARGACKANGAVLSSAKEVGAREERVGESRSAHSVRIGASEVRTSTEVGVEVAGGGESRR